MSIDWDIKERFVSSLFPNRTTTTYVCNMYYTGGSSVFGTR